MPLTVEVHLSVTESKISCFITKCSARTVEATDTCTWTLDCVIRRLVNSSNRNVNCLLELSANGRTGNLYYSKHAAITWQRRVLVESRLLKNRRNQLACPWHSYNMTEKVREFAYWAEQASNTHGKFHYWTEQASNRRGVAWTVPYKGRLLYPVSPKTSFNLTLLWGHQSVLSVVLSCWYFPSFGHLPVLVEIRQNEWHHLIISPLIIALWNVL